MAGNSQIFSFKGRRGYLHVLYYGENIVRFLYNEEPGPCLFPPNSVTTAVQLEPAVNIASIQDRSITSKLFTVDVDEDTLAVRITDRNGVVISEDVKVDPRVPGLSKKMLWEKAIYGNGEKYSWLNQLGSVTSHYNYDVMMRETVHTPLVREMHTAIPFYIGVAPRRAYGIFFDNSHRTHFDFNGRNRGEINFNAGGGLLDYYFIYGPTIADVVGFYGQLTGTLNLPPKKYLGYHQSRYSYENSEELLAVAEKLRRHDIPCDVLFLDIHYMDAFKVFTVDRKRFRDFRAVIKKLTAMGFSVTAMINPGVKVESGYRVYEEGKENKYFVKTADGDIYQGEVWPKPAAFPDFLRGDVRQWWGELHRELLECGVESICNDMNEPADFSRASGTLPDDARHTDDQGLEIPHSAAHNVYGLFQTRATYEALERLRPGRRPFVLTRAASSGSQRYSALWTGDNASIWEHLESSIPMLLNLGLSGYCFVGADVGGYRGDCSGELLVRWTQLGAFFPYFRNHSEIGTARQEPYAHGPEVLAIIRKYIHLRYSLLTYIYNLVRNSTLTGAPAARPLVYHYQDDPKTYHLNDQFLLGAGLMVCPVLRPGQDQRLVYFPEGLWHDYWTGELYEGSSYHAVKAPLEVIPLYVAAGTILPHDHLQGDDRAGEEETGLTMHCYGGKAGTYLLYLDDGESNDYKNGKYSEIEVSMTGDPAAPKISTRHIHAGYELPELNFVIHEALHNKRY